MKINIKEFNLLTREPDQTQEFEGKQVGIFFMNEDETQVYSLNQRFAIWSSDGKNFKLLIDKEYYDFGKISEFYKPEVNEKWLSYIDKISKMQRKILLTLMLPVMIAYLAIAIVTLIFLNDYAIYVLIGLMAVIFGVNILQNKMVKTNMDKENDIIQKEIQDLLGIDNYDQIASDQIKFRESKAPVYEENDANTEQVQEITDEVVDDGDKEDEK